MGMLLLFIDTKVPSITSVDQVILNTNTFSCLQWYGNK